MSNEVWDTKPLSWSGINAGTEIISNTTELATGYMTHVTGIVNTSQKNVNYKIGEGTGVQYQDLPYKLPVYIELSSNTDLSSYNFDVDGNEIIATNTSAGIITLTLDGSTSEDIAPDQTFKAKYYDSKWIMELETTTLATTTTYTPIHENNHLICDVSGGNITITLSNPTFAGQKCHIIADGSGIAKVTNTALYANGVYITENTGGLWLECVNNGGTLEWKAENGITAGYTSSSSRVLQYSNGRCVQSKNQPVVFSSVSALKGTFTFTVNFTSTPSGALVSLDSDNLSLASVGSANVYTQYSSLSTSSISTDIRRGTSLGVNFNAADTGTVYCSVEGDYA